MTRKRKKHPEDAPLATTPGPEPAVARPTSATDKPRGFWLGHRDIIVLLTWLVFLNAMPNDFHLDDFYRVKDNPGIHRLWPVWRHFVDPRTSATAPHLVQFRPLLPLTLSINYAISKDSVGGYHVGNLLIHVASALLLYALLLELLTHWSTWVADDRWRGRLAFGVALIYGIHPVSGIPVNYICARDLLLMQVFLVASLLSYVRLRRLGGTPLRWAWTLAALALSLMGKTNSIVAPALILLFELFVAGEPILSLRPWLRTLPFVAVIVALFAYTKFVLHFSDLSNVVGLPGSSPWEYPLTQLRLHLFEYVRNFFWPFLIRQGPLIEPAHSFLEPGVIAGALFILATIVAAFALRKTAPLISFCILAYWVLMAPETSVVRFHHMAAYYRAYPSSPYFYLVLALLAYRFIKPRVLLPAFGVLLVFFAGSSVYLNTTWRTGYSLWSYSVKYGGEPVAHLNLAMSCSDLGLRKEHLEEALQLAPNYTLAHIDLGLTLISLDAPDEGLEHLRKAVTLEPNSTHSHYWLSVGYTNLGRKADAARESAEAVRLDPRNVKYQLKAARDKQAIGDFQGSLADLNTVLQYEPDQEEAPFLQAYALQMTGDNEAAIRVYQAFLTRRPGDYQAQFNLGFALMKLGRYRDAADHFEQALTLKPDYRAAHLHLATCYDKLGDAPAAARHRAAYQGVREPSR